MSSAASLSPGHDVGKFGQAEGIDREQGGHSRRSVAFTAIAI